MSRLNASQIILNERLRIAGITESPEGVRAPKLARELALRSELSADAANAILRADPRGIALPCRNGKRRNGPLGARRPRRRARQERATQGRDCREYEGFQRCNGLHQVRAPDYGERKTFTASRGENHYGARNR